MASRQHIRNKIPFLVGMTLASLASCSFANQTGESSKQNSQETTKIIKVDAMKKMSRDEQISFSKQDLAVRLELEVDAVTLSGAISVTWRSSALGCPKPSQEYMQSLVPGVMIMLRVDNTAYRYHAVPGMAPFFCPKNMAESPYTNSSDA